VSVRRRELAQVAGLWLGLAALRWLAALPVVQPRIFRDELLHWQLARSFVTHRPFLVSGQVVDYPAVLYPAILSLGLHGTDLHRAFHYAQGLNALMMSAVVLFAYALARELVEHRSALAVAALAGIAPAGVYSVFIMEENAYYPLFVASCWLGWRVLVYGRWRDALGCAIALALTYFAKPLAVPLVAAYAGVVMLWLVTELLERRGGVRSVLKPLATRLAPVAAFGAMLVVRHALTARGADGSESGVVLGRFYSEELGGALLPPLKPFSAVVLALALALALGVGIAPVVGILSGWRARVADRRRFWLALFAIAVAWVYVFAAARHTMVINRMPKIHERYAFAVGPLFLALFFADAAALSVVAIVVASAGIAVVMARIAGTALPENTWVNGPSMTGAWLAYTKLSSGVVVGLLLGAVTALVCWLVLRVRARRGTMGVAAVLAVPLLVLNVIWYAFVYHIQAALAPMQHTIAALESLAPRGSRITAIVSADRDPMAMLSYYGKFWLEDRLTVYWTGRVPGPWYVDSIGPSADAVRATRATYLLGLPGESTQCAGSTSTSTSLATIGVALPVEVIAVPSSGCAPPKTP
jgi:hypothetical protein